jgi:hypothetical protein
MCRLPAEAAKACNVLRDREVSAEGRGMASAGCWSPTYPRFRLNTSADSNIFRNDSPLRTSQPEMSALNTHA